jgi:hypothetical protein
MDNNNCVFKHKEAIEKYHEISPKVDKSYSKKQKK